MKKWFVRLYLPAMVLVLTIGMFFVLKFGYARTPPLVIKPSHFSAPAEIGEVVFRRFYMPVKEARIVAFGIPPQPAYHREILSAFIRSAAREGVDFDVVIAEEQMPDLKASELSAPVQSAPVPSASSTPASETVAGAPIQIVKLPTNTQTHSELIDAINQNAGKRILLYLPSVFATHLISGSLIERLEKVLGHGILSFTSGPLALAADQEYIVDPPCLGSERDNGGTSPLGCEILRAGRGFYRKKIAQDKWAAIMNQPTPAEDYLLMVSEPGQDKGNEDANRTLRMAPPADRGEQAR